MQGLGWEQLIPVLGAGFLAGLIDSIGGGGGLISVPAFLAAGVPPVLLLGTNKSMAGTGSGVAVFRYARAGLLPRMPKRDWIALVLISVVCGALGAAISTLPWFLDHLRIWIPVLLLAVMFFLVKRWFWDERRVKGSEIFHGTTQDLQPLRNPWTRAAIGGIAGYDGLFGPGTGTFFLSFLERCGLRTLNANAVTKVLNLGSNAGALLYFGLHGRVLWPMGLAAAGTFMLGNYIGSGLVLRSGQVLVRVTVVVMTSLVLIKYAWSWV